MIGDLNIKLWYISEYPTDDIGFEIAPEITFKNLFENLIQHKDIYKVLHVYDSIVRERVFAKLVQIYNLNYSTIYNLWLESIN